MYLTEEKILQHGRSSPYKRRFKDPTVSMEVENQLCGDSLKIEIIIAKGEVCDVAFTGEGCLISQAAASLLLGEIKRVKDLKIIKKFDEKTVFKLLGFKPTLSRIKCAILVLEAIRQALRLHPGY